MDSWLYHENFLYSFYKAVMCIFLTCVWKSSKHFHSKQHKVSPQLIHCWSKDYIYSTKFGSEYLLLYTDLFTYITYIRATNRVMSIVVFKDIPFLESFVCKRKNKEIWFSQHATSNMQNFSPSWSIFRGIGLEISLKI